MKEDFKIMGKMALTWVIIAVGGLIGLLIGSNLGYFIAPLVAVFISLLIFGK